MIITFVIVTIMFYKHHAHWKISPEGWKTKGGIISIEV